MLKLCKWMFMNNFADGRGKKMKIDWDVPLHNQVIWDVEKMMDYQRAVDSAKWMHEHGFLKGSELELVRVRVQLCLEMMLGYERR